MRSLAEIPLTLLFSWLNVHDASFPHAILTLAEYYGQQFMQTHHQASICGKEYLQNNDFSLHVLCTALFNPQCNRKVSPVRLFLVTVVEFQK